MQSKFRLTILKWTIFVVLFTLLEVKGKPTIDSIALLDPKKLICSVETTNLCQQCAKHTKSDDVYPWCCANHEGVRDWCGHYLHFGLP
ncbi:uncharacterized protein [Venturia canescens]|uniref:uncharacterized protein n=1 Tax=Venturia canescens TaxID=32260 RepID=UPI001C9D50E3|nr:uncharacterized protein LOC122414342 [Venturia canescens]